MCPARALRRDYRSPACGVSHSTSQAALKPFDMTLNKKIMFSNSKVVSNLNVIWLAIKRRAAKQECQHGGNFFPANLH